jgi:hypothetical protein
MDSGGIKTKPDIDDPLASDQYKSQPSLIPNNPTNILIFTSSRYLGFLISAIRVLRGVFAAGPFKMNCRTVAGFATLFHL